LQFNLNSLPDDMVHALHNMKETGNLPWQKPHRLDVVPRQYFANAIEGHADREERRPRWVSLRTKANLWWIDSPLNLMVATVIPSESGLEEL
jgi:hypothetical protein